MDPTFTRQRKYELGEAPVNRDIGDVRARQPLDASIDTPFGAPASDLDEPRPFYAPAPFNHYRGLAFGVARARPSFGLPRRRGPRHSKVEATVMIEWSWRVE